MIVKRLGDGDMAAVQLDEPVCAVFLRKIQDGIYPKAVRFRGCRLRWRKPDLDATIPGLNPTISLDDDL
jgi:hypothetical protein